ncbi:MAG TPA: pyridoxal phosphate-dependent aminotransferase [Methanomassiliicoccales archaeon]|nr:pyridoxal phosphate-dependent aminotransferase [Methanomassiliicoccales archaeon]
MKLTVSDRSQMIVQSEIRNMTLECNKIDGINLAQGVCDLDVPLEVIGGAHQAALHGYNQYTRYDGLPALRKALTKKLRDFNHIEVEEEGNIIVSAGATGAFYCACLALLNPGDECIVFEPFYGYHVNSLLAVDAVPVYAQLRPPDWKFDMKELESLVTGRTKAMVVNTPSNPSGKVFSREELQKLADFAKKHDIFVFTDEIYEYFVYDGREHVSMATLDGMFNRTVTIGGYSKTFSITGWRVGYAATAKIWAQMIGYVNDLVYVCAPAPLQIGVANGIEKLPASYYEGICADYQKKRGQICEALAAAGLAPYVPEGSYYVLADVSAEPGTDSKDRALHILKKTGVASVPGSAFYHDKSGESLTRFCFAKRDQVLEDACKRLRQYE